MNIADNSILMGISPETLLTGAGQGAPLNRLTVALVNPRPGRPVEFANRDGLAPREIRRRILDGASPGASAISLHIRYADGAEEAVNPLVRDLGAAKSITAAVRGGWDFDPFDDHPLMDNTAWAVITCRKGVFPLDHLASVSFTLRDILCDVPPGLAWLRADLMDIGGMEDESFQWNIGLEKSLPEVARFFPSPGTARPGGKVTFVSLVNDLGDAVIQPGGHPVNTPVDVTVAGRREEYELRSKKGWAKLHVHAAPPEIILFDVDEKDPSSVEWATANGESVTLDGEMKPPAGTARIGAEKKSMTLRCANALGSVEKIILTADRTNVRRFARTTRRRPGLTTAAVEWEVRDAEAIAPAFADEAWHGLGTGNKGAWEGIVTCEGPHNRARVDFTAGGEKQRFVL